MRSNPDSLNRICARRSQCEYESLGCVCVCVRVYSVVQWTDISAGELYLFDEFGKTPFSRWLFIQGETSVVICFAIA